MLSDGSAAYTLAHTHTHSHTLAQWNQTDICSSYGSSAGPLRFGQMKLL